MFFYFYFVTHACYPYKILIHILHIQTYIYAHTLCIHNALEIMGAKQVAKKKLMVSEWSESAQIVHLRFMTEKLRPKNTPNATTHNESDPE